MDNYKQYYFMWVAFMEELGNKSMVIEDKRNFIYEDEVTKNMLARMAQMQASYILEV